MCICRETMFNVVLTTTNNQSLLIDIAEWCSTDLQIHTTKIISNECCKELMNDLSKKTNHMFIVKQQTISYIVQCWSTFIN